MTDAAQHDARREAADWHARLQSRSVSNEELERFYRWRGDPTNSRAFEVIDRLWSSSADLGRDPAVRRATREAGRVSPWRWPSFRMGRRQVGAVVLVVSLFVAAMTGLLDWRRTYRTGTGQTLVVRLDDGSKVTLNTDSRVAVRFSGDRRDVELLQGQAYFEVAHDAERPFRVTAADTKVTAVGTQFEVWRDLAGVRVTLVQGRISVSSASTEKPAQLASVGQTLVASGSAVAIGRRDPAVELSWVDGKIDLREVPLRDAIAEVNRYIRSPVILEAKELSSTKISGIFATGDRDAFVKAVTTLLRLRATRQEDGSVRLGSPDGQ